MMIIWVVAIGAILYYGLGGTKNVSNFHKNDPNDMLKERFVNGEIDEQTYLQMKETLKR